ncbi:hypothetical protein INH39_19745 [Massilia violaceinigra]|uniref:Uncharacterized protein n=1 Tax=Massilia violaceinigra TaxID=2045208 RepID=A0ABY4AGI5_9BURK|nr:hypothetical protein [Massilia violaceinigra]UOD33687.1 hypothetical protein INH39_19745 [Massilia violaceinigra]
MATSINGFGTIYYGEADYQSDHSFITTKWLICLFIPIIPLASLRLRYVDVPGFFWTRTEYQEIHQIPINFLQVAKTWGYSLGLFLAIYLPFPGQHATGLKSSVIVGLMLLPLVLRWLARRQPAARPEQMHARKERLSRAAPETQIITNCPKCRYRRKPEDEAPAWQCPSCKVAYNKVMRGNGF